MKNTNHPAHQRIVRHWFKQAFQSFINHLTCTHDAEVVALREKYQELEELVDIIAREVARQAKRRK